jgi:uncharacterized protein
MNIDLVQMRLQRRRGTSFRHRSLAGIGYRAGTLAGGPEQPVIPKLAKISYRSYNNLVPITYDPAKRRHALLERGLDFEDARYVFDGPTLEVEDRRKDYGEVRMVCYGLLQGRLVVVGYTPRGADRHVFSMRKANEREQNRIGPQIGL